MSIPSNWRIAIPLCRILPTKQLRVKLVIRLELQIFVPIIRLNWQLNVCFFVFRCLLTNWNGIVLHWVPVASCFIYWCFNIAFTEHVYFFVPIFTVFEQTNPELSELMQLPKYHEFAVNLWSVWKLDELPLRFMERFQFRLHFFLLGVCIYKRLGLIMLIKVSPRIKVSPSYV